MLIHLTHPWEIRLFHWSFVIVIVLKLWSGMYISSPDPLWGFPSMYSARILHATLTPVMAALLIFRIYYSLLTGDWQNLLVWRLSHLAQLRPWLRYTFFLGKRPPLPGKTAYHIGPRLLFTAIFLTMPFFFATGVVMLNLPYFRWLTIFFGGKGTAGTIHFLAAVFLTSFVAMHIYLAVTTNLGRLKAMLKGQSTITEHGGERIEQTEGDSTGGAGQPGHVR